MLARAAEMFSEQSITGRVSPASAQRSLCSCYHRVDVYGIGERGVLPSRLLITVRVIALRGVTRSRPVCISHLLAKSVDSPAHAPKAPPPPSHPWQTVSPPV